MEIEDFKMDYYNDVLDLWIRAGISIGSSDDKIEIQKMLERNPRFFLIGKENDKLIAVVQGGYDGRRGYVHHLAVDPAYQKKGYGKMLMHELMDRFRQNKVHKIHLFVEKHNKNAIAFYKRLGWEQRKYLTMMSFVPDDALYRSSI
ncbi:MAG: GNAT family N-acetyltransferase [Candidatus Lokiarchaeota archaeon]|nr:GNAT family N-acetyltransferase [Candidatus Lokiarchaeota archaeon]